MVELVMILVVLGIVSAYAVMRGFSATDVTLPSQAQKMSTDLRHAQALASTWGKSLCFVTGVNNYYVSLKGVTACENTAVTDPASGGPFSWTLQKDVTFTVGQNSSFSFNSLGQPSGSASFRLSSGSSTSDVTVEAITGKVTP